LIIFRKFFENFLKKERENNKVSSRSASGAAGMYPQNIVFRRVNEGYAAPS
jgi:hypothetical protein